MKRRSFLGLLAGAVAAPVAARVPALPCNTLHAAPIVPGTITANELAVGVIHASRIEVGCIPINMRGPDGIWRSGALTKHGFEPIEGEPPLPDMGVTW